MTHFSYLVLYYKTHLFLTGFDFVLLESLAIFQDVPKKKKTILKTLLPMSNLLRNSVCVIFTKRKFCVKVQLNHLGKPESVVVGS